MTKRQHTKFSGIYAIRNIHDGKLYIGSAVNFRKRWGLHRRQLEAGTHHSRHLQGAWNKYGAAAFVWEILEFIEDDDALILVEQQYLDHFEPWRDTNGYNTYPTAGSSRGAKQSEATRAKLSAIRKGKPASAWRREHLAKLNQNRTPESRAQAAANNKGKKRSAETKARVSAAQKGKTLSAEHRAKLSIAFQNMSPERRAKMTGAMKGRKFSEEHKAKISEALTGRLVSDEARANMSKSQKERAARLKAEEHALAEAALRERFGGPPCPWIEDGPAATQLTMFDGDD